MIPASGRTTCSRLLARLTDLFEAETGGSYPRERPEAADLRAGSLNNKALSMLDLGEELDAAKYWEQALEID